MSLAVEEGEIVALVGANAAGKTTTINTISGIIRPIVGAITFRGQRIDHLNPYDVVALGLVQVPEGRRLFPYMTVLENLELGAYSREARRQRAKSLEMVLGLLPILKERQGQLAGSLSGGEQQMLAIGRGLMALPRLLMLDEPSLGLAPMLMKQILETVRDVNARGMTVLLVEQNVQHSLRLAHRGYVLENGRIVLEGQGSELLGNPHLKKAYLGM
ncbi:MAG: ABC transporter ATP-binding protein [Chloroflexi bacterium]|nr:ABC transporter ATP-binding protein [Chloroflexota bacterium]